MIRPRPTFYSDLRQLFVLLLLGWLLFNFLDTLRYVATDYSPVPIWDYWREVQFLPGREAFHWSKLWIQHNEHRILFPELTYIADTFLFHGRLYVPMAVSGLCYIGVWLVLVWSAFSQKRLPSPFTEAAVLTAGIMMAWHGCSSVLATPFQLQFTMLQFAAMVALALVASLAETGRKGYLVAVVAAAAVCTYSSGNGMFLWPVLIAAAFLLRVGLRRILLLTACGFVLCGIYFIGYHFLPSQSAASLRHPAMALKFLCLYFSMPFGSFVSIGTGVFLGACNLLLMAFCGLAAWKQGWLKSRLGIVIFGAYLFYLLSALLATGARLDVHDPTFANAKAWRYVTVPTVSWALVALASIWITAWNQTPKRAYAVVLVTLVLFGYGFLKARHWAEATRRDFQNAQITAVMLENNIFDPEQLRTGQLDPGVDCSYCQKLKNNRKSVWAHGEDKWIGGDIRRRNPHRLPIEGRVTRVYPVVGGYEILGWTDAPSLTTDHAVLFVDDNDRIVGFGQRASAGMPPNFSTSDTPQALSFAGFIAAQQPLNDLLVYVRTFHGKVTQPLPGKIHLPSFAPVPSNTDADALPGITWKPDANWGVNAYPVSMEDGVAPKSVIYGSDNSQARTGSIRTEPFVTPSDHCLVIPVLNSGAEYGQTIEVQDAATQQVIAMLPFIDGRPHWKRWRIPIPAEVHSVQIVANDQGSGPDEWSALATPEQCK